MPFCALLVRDTWWVGPQVLVQGVEACNLHKQIVKVNEVPYLVTHVGVNEYIARSLLVRKRVRGTVDPVLVSLLSH